MKHILISISAVILLASCSGPKENSEITEYELFQHVAYLASDSLKGRLPGTAEDKLAASYIASEFKRAGLSLPGDGGLQSFEVITDLESGENNTMVLGSQHLEAGVDFSPFPFTANSSLDAEVIFAGFGFDLDMEDIKWNDYATLEVSGKWVMVLRGNPEIDSSTSVFHAFSNERDKAMLAADQGAGGILFVSGPAYSQDDQLTDLGAREGKVGIPAIHISRKTADQLLGKTGETIESLEKKLVTQRKPYSISANSSLKASADVKPTLTNTYNVVAYLEGSDPQGKDKFIVMGAHYDHLGMGGQGSSSRRQDTIAPHNGADDNASGVAALIEVAEKLAGGEKKPANSFIFIAFGAEEMGLLGSKYYVDNPLFPLENIRIMLNMDMLGRLRDQQVQVGGVGTTPISEDMVMNRVSHDSLSISTTREGYGASDHTSFYGKDIPVLFITTGAHTEYHTPDDDVESLNIPGMVTVSNYVYELADYVDGLEETLTFQEAGPKVRYSGRHGRGIALGIMPDFTDNDEEQGMRVDNVNPGQPAFMGGMKKGDYIMAIEGMPVNGIYDYMYRLSKMSKGQIIVVTVKRQDANLDLLIQL